VNAGAITARLAGGPGAVRSVALVVSASDHAWKPSPSDWSVLEIVCHLADEEEEDFARRIRLLLEDPEMAWPAIDPEGWAVERDYASRDIDNELDRFARSRRDNLAWLEARGTIDWSTKKTHPVMGSMHAGDLLAAWAAHDALHIRQIARRLHQLAARDAGGFTPEYAGSW